MGIINLMQLKRGVCVELIEALKKTYADSDKMIVIAGKNMEMLWNNSEKLKGFSPDKLRLFDGSDPVLPIKKKRLLLSIKGFSANPALLRYSLLTAVNRDICFVFSTATILSCSRTDRDI